ncbi:MAG: serine hydroxymethyltransferase [Phycisphaerae bacterium]|nr:serine hydroxymethyltransferase [Phycisphaerae bacterium]
MLEGLSSQEYHQAILDALKETDGQFYQLLTREYDRRQKTLQLGAAENQCSQAVLAALGSVLQNKTAEGFVGARMHGGCEVVDDVEGAAVSRAEETFGAQYANVQPHSGTQANQIVLTAVLEKGDRLLGMAIGHGGHYSHGASNSFTGKFFEVENYGVDGDTFVLDYDVIRDKAIKFKPKLIICGASAYPRTLDFKRFREIADEVGAYLLADISHISGLVIAGAHPSPIDFAHFTTTSTYKPGGPRGGLILMGKDYVRKIKVGTKDVPLWEHIDEVTFPGVQGTPYFNNMAAKAVFFKETLSDEYRGRQFKIVENAKRLAGSLVDFGYDVVTGGTDNHMVLVNVAKLREGLTGPTAQKCLEECGIVVDMIHLPYESRAAVADGIRLGTPIVTKNGMGSEEMEGIAALIDAVLKRVEVVSDGGYRIGGSLKEQTQGKVKDLCGRFPLR